MRASSAQAIDTNNRFEEVLYLAALAFYGLPANYRRTFSLMGTRFSSWNPALAAKSNIPLWVQMNEPIHSMSVAKKAHNADIAYVKNITLDFEYPPQPDLVHTVGIVLADRLVRAGWAEPGLPVEDSGAGCHIVLPIPAISTAAYGGGECVNLGVARFVKAHVEPLFREIADERGLPASVSLEGYDISRLLSTPGTWRPGGSKPGEADYLKHGYTRRWLDPYISTYPVRKESAALAGAICNLIDYTVTSESVPAPVRVPLKTPSSLESWIQDYANEKRRDDRSDWFHAVVGGVYKRFGENVAFDQANLIDHLTGAKYEGRAGVEVERSLAKLTQQLREDEARRPPAQEVSPSKVIQMVKRPPSTPETPSNSQGDTNEVDYTDTGNAKRFAKLQAGKLMHVNAWGWCHFDSRRWQPKAEKQALHATKDVIGDLYQEASKLVKDGDESKGKNAAQWGIRSQMAQRRVAILALAMSEPEMSGNPQEFDTQPLLLNVGNGVLDLQMNSLLPHSPSHRMTRLAPTGFNPDAKCPRWLSFLERVTGGNQALVDYLQRAVGYSLTGDVSEQCFFFLYGTGKNGKSTFIETMKALLGDYADAAQFSLLLAKDRSNAGAASPDLASLAGKRFVSAVEPDQGVRFAESILKQLTGGDTVSARFLYKDGFSFRPQYKLWLAGNYRPTISGQDEGIWRRVKLIPFTQFIKPEEREKNLDLKLRSELPGILAWAVRGYAAWRRDGLQEPTAILEATAEYRDDNDILRDFLAAESIQGSKYKVQVAHLFAAYRKFCQDIGDNPLGRKRFTETLRARGLLLQRSTGVYWVYGLALLDNSHKAEPTQWEMVDDES